MIDKLNVPGPATRQKGASTETILLLISEYINVLSGR